jgi:hypothetical protein
LLLVASSCNYLPFPCNLIPVRNTDFNIDPIEREDESRFEILKDTIISQKSILNKKLNLAKAGLNNENNNVSLKSAENTNCVFIKTSVTKETEKNQTITITKKEIYTIEKINSNSSLAGNIYSTQPVAVKLRKQTITVTKTEQHS